MKTTINKMNKILLKKIMSGSCEKQGIVTNLNDFNRAISEVKGFSRN